MKHIIRSLFVILLLLFVTVSCYRDIGNYDYTPLPEIRISSKDTIYVKQFDTLHLGVEVDFDGQPANEYDFEWRIWANTVGGEDKKKSIGTNKELIYYTTESPGSYALVLTCRNKETDVKVYKEITLLIQGTISEGWMVLQEKNGKTDFDLIMTPFISKRIEKDVILSDLYESVNGEPLKGKGVKIGSYYALGRYQYVTILTEDGGVRLSAVTMQKTYDIPTLMLDKKPLKVENYFYFPYYWCLGRGSEVIISDGRYYINEMLGKGFTEPILKGGETYKSSRWAPRWLWTYKGMIYDELKGRFLGIKAPMLTATSLPEAVGRICDWNDMKASLRYIETGFKHYEYALMEDWNTHQLTLYVFNFDAKNNFDVAKYSADHCSELDQALYYAVGERGNIFYYSTGKDIYLYDYIGTNTSKKVYTVKDGELITNMKILKPTLHKIVPNHPYDNKVLILSTHNERTGEGKVYMYYFNESNGEIDFGSEKVFSGFGRIIDMDYNFPKYGT